MLIGGSCNGDYIVREFLTHVLNAHHNELDIFILHLPGKLNHPSAALSLTHQFGRYRKDDFLISQTMLFPQCLRVTAIEHILGVHTVIDHTDIPILQERAAHSVCQPSGGGCDHNLFQVLPLGLLPAEHLFCEIKEERCRIFPYLRTVSAAGLPPLTVVRIAAFASVGILTVERIHQRNITLGKIVIQRLQVYKIRMRLMKMYHIGFKRIHKFEQSSG